MPLKENQPLISISIPVFNGENYIGDCINSVLEQDYENFELNIVDNCSTDSTEKIVKRISDNRINYIKNAKNIGALKNFAKCVDIAKGEYFVLLPHDDLLLPGFLSSYASKLLSDGTGLVYSAINVVDKNGKEIYVRTTFPENNLFSFEEAILELFDKFCPIQLAMVKTKILREVGNFDHNFGLFIDVNMWLKVMLQGWDVYYFSKPYSSHRSHDEQGQIAFLNLNLDILSDHWGRRLDRSFWREHSYNRYFLHLMNFVIQELDNKIILDRVKLILLKIFIKSHLRFIALSTLKLNFWILKEELVLFKFLFKIFPIRSLFLYYLSVSFVEIKARLLKKLGVKK